MWKCLKCGESHNDIYDLCWKCGTDKNGKMPPQASGGVFIKKLNAFKDIPEEKPKESLEEYMQRTGHENEKIIHRQNILLEGHNIRYVSGGFGFMKACNGNFILTNSRLIFYTGNKRLGMSFDNIKDISIQNTQNITSGMILFAGPYAWAHKKCLIIEYYDKIKTNIAFESPKSHRIVEWWFNKIQTQRYEYANNKTGL